MSSSTDTPPPPPESHPPAGPLRVCTEAQASTADVEWVIQKMTAFNQAGSGGLDYAPLQLFLRDETGRLYGGLLGWTLWSWLHIDSLFVEKSLRGQGHGLRLLRAAERVATARGCTLAEVDTFNFQAKGFYEKAGYHVFGSLPGIGGRFERFYLSRKLG